MCKAPGNESHNHSEGSDTVGDLSPKLQEVHIFTGGVYSVFSFSFFFYLIVSSGYIRYNIYCDPVSLVIQRLTLTLCIIIKNK